MENQNRKPETIAPAAADTSRTRSRTTESASPTDSSAAKGPARGAEGAATRNRERWGGAESLRAQVNDVFQSQERAGGSAVFRDACVINDRRHARLSHTDLSRQRVPKDKGSKALAPQEKDPSEKLSQDENKKARAALRAELHQELREIPGAEAHHIIPLNDGNRAIRENLQTRMLEAGIPINSRENGVALPRDHSVPNPEGRLTHQELVNGNMEAYMRALHSRLGHLKDEAFRRELAVIKTEMQKGEFDFSVRGRARARDRVGRDDRL